MKAKGGGRCGNLMRTLEMRPKRSNLSDSSRSRTSSGKLPTNTRAILFFGKCITKERSNAKSEVFGNTSFGLVKRKWKEFAMQEAGPRIDEHFDRIRANLIRCEECNENFFFDFLRHPRYFVTHFKTCHLKNVLYRFNGCSEEENQRVRFGPRRKKDATTWFGQLKSTEKRMISMQDNKWGEIAERECWSCRLCKHTRKTSEMPHAFEPNELGRRQALLHLRQYHEAAYNVFLSMLPAVQISPSRQATTDQMSNYGIATNVAPKITTKSMEPHQGHAISPSSHGQSIEADRSRLRRMRATPEAKKAEAERSKRRREQLTPAQRQMDADRRARKRQRVEERARSRVRRAEASPEAREREMKRSRDRRLNATEQQRKREAQRSRRRRQNATDEQRLRERERCRRRYEVQKQQRLLAQQETTSDVEMRPSTPATSVSDTTTPPISSCNQFNPNDQYTPSQVMPADLERRNEQLLQQQAGLGMQIRSLYAALSRPSWHIEL
ncbi:Hypothetical protein PHPALM_9536 [Phytophthora palmivora]|uniref:Uncharacterized protein n=1 Tax=Phytophthora palmivora TaxID=4796 RepID=A0A2P4Y7E2_9STRA|nr:Hypothetical protein PHPALM_9536 [Phytophthora palmivora]